MNDPRIYDDALLQRTLERISFENSVLNFRWKFHIKPVRAHMDITPPTYDSPGTETVREGWLIWAEFKRPDAYTGRAGTGRGRDEIIWKGTTVSGVIKTAWVVVEMLVRHELMEGFKVDGKRPFNPHNTIDALNSLEASAEDTYNLDSPSRMTLQQEQEGAEAHVVEQAVERFFPTYEITDEDILLVLTTHGEATNLDDSIVNRAYRELRSENDVVSRAIADSVTADPQAVALAAIETLLIQKGYLSGLRRFFFRDSAEVA